MLQYDFKVNLHWTQNFVSTLDFAGGSRNAETLDMIEGSLALHQ